MPKLRCDLGNGAACPSAAQTGLRSVSPHGSYPCGQGWSVARSVDVADIFVSYTSSDREWAFWIGFELEALGHVPHIHEWEISGGADIVAWMEERLQAADHVLCVISN